MLKICFFFSININFKKKNNNIKLIFLKNVKKMLFIFNKKKKISFYNIVLEKDSLRKGLITILKSPFHYKITKLNISENIKKLRFNFYINNLKNNKEIFIIDKESLLNYFPTFNYFTLIKVKVTYKTIL